MGLNRQDKAAVIEEVAGIVANSSSIVIAEYRGLSVEAVTKLRAEARKNNVTLRVVKNTLVRRAVEGTEFAGLADQFVGPLVYGFSADPVAAAKVLVNFAKDNDKLVIKGGAMANTVMDVEAVKQLATMPSREELLAKLMATMNLSPSSSAPSTKSRPALCVPWLPCAMPRNRLLPNLNFF